MPPRFHIERLIAPGEETVVLSAEESRHLARVLRLVAGDEARLFDNGGAEFRVAVERASARGAELRILGRAEPRGAPLRNLTLCVALIRNEPMSWLVQKATELGVARLAPFVSERTVVAPEARAENAAARRRRLERVSLAACKQSGRNQPLEIADPVGFSEALRESSGAALAVFAWEGGDAPSLGEVLAQGLRGGFTGGESRFVLAIGPEGGFSPAEHALALEMGWTAAGLGPLILRAETAALAGAAMILGWPGP